MQTATFALLHRFPDPSQRASFRSLLKAKVLKAQCLAVLFHGVHGSLWHGLWKLGFDLEGDFHLCPVEAGEVLDHFFYDGPCCAGHEALVEDGGAVEAVIVRPLCC